MQEVNEAPFHSVALGDSWMRPPISRGTQRSSDQIKMENMTQPEMHKLHGVQITIIYIYIFYLKKNIELLEKI